MYVVTETGVRMRKIRRLESTVIMDRSSSTNSV